MTHHPSLKNTIADLLTKNGVAIDTAPVMPSLTIAMAEDALRLELKQSRVCMSAHVHAYMCAGGKRTAVGAVELRDLYGRTEECGAVAVRPLCVRRLRTSTARVPHLPCARAECHHTLSFLVCVSIRIHLLSSSSCYCFYRVLLLLLFSWLESALWNVF
jgi:hypothetical protein